MTNSLLPTALLTLALGCSAPTAPELSEELEKTIGVAAGSVDETALVHLISDESLDTDRLRTAGVSAPAIETLLSVREQVALEWTLAPFDNVAPVSTRDWFALRSFANANGYDFTPLSFAALELADDVARPSIDDVTVLRSYDGRPAERSQEIVRKQVTHVIADENEALIATSSLRAHKFATIVAGNFFAEGSPNRQFWDSLPHGANVSVVGTLSAEHSAIVSVDDAGRRSYYVLSGRRYSLIDSRHLRPDGSLRYPVVMRVDLRRDERVRVSYPSWYAPLLMTPVSTLTEG